MATTGIGIGILVAGLLFVATARGSADVSAKDALVRTLTRVLVHAVVGIGIGFLVTALDSSVARLLTAGLGIALVGWAAVRAMGSQTPARRLVILGAMLGVSLVMGLVSAAVFGETEAGGAEPGETNAAMQSDAEADCECDQGLDVVSVGLSDAGALVVEVAGDIPEDGRFWVWPADSPLTPIELTRTGGEWLVGSESLADPAGVVLSGSNTGFELQLGWALEGSAVTSSGADRAPDSGYAGIGPEEASERVAGYQAAYADLSEGERVLARSFLLMPAGSYEYAVGITSDPGVPHSATLVNDSASQFTLAATDTRGGHVSRYQEGEAECRDESLDVCAGMWLDPFQGFEDLLADEATIVPVAGRVVLDRQTRCVAVTDTGSTSLHEGEFCVYPDGTFAFVDDRTVGFVAVLSEVAGA